MLEATISKFFEAAKYSEITEEFPDKDKYPLYYQASRHEFTLEEGEMLFIPAGWFHFVFSEDPNPTTHVNFAVNFWYNSATNWVRGNTSHLLPEKQAHQIRLGPKEVYGESVLKVYRSKLDGLFPSDRCFKLYPGKVWAEFMTFDEFYETKNPEYYIVQNTSKGLEQYAPPYPTPIYLAGGWCNFGNCRTLMHYDEHDNWLCQIQGRRRVVMFPPEDQPNLYTFGNIPPNIHDSILRYIDLEHNNIVLRTVPNLKMTDMVSVYKEHGDAFSKMLSTRQINMPSFPAPLQFKEVHTNGQFYNDSQNYPIVFIYVTDGKGYIQIAGRDPIQLTPGNLLMFPSTYTYPWTTEGNLKLIVPI